MKTWSTGLKDTKHKAIYHGRSSVMGKIGFIGLGIMGRPMAKNLIKAGYELVVYDVVGAAVDELCGCGAERGANPADVAAKAGEFIITMLPNSPHVREVTAGANGLMDGVRSGQIVVDMSSISPIVSRELNAMLKEKGVEMIDAPVSGGQEKAEKGTLAIMAGGDAAAFEKARPVLEKMGATVTLVGESGRRRPAQGVRGDTQGARRKPVPRGQSAENVREPLRAGLPHQPPHQGPLECA